MAKPLIPLGNRWRPPPILLGLIGASPLYFPIKLWGLPAPWAFQATGALRALVLPGGLLLGRRGLQAKGLEGFALFLLKYGLRPPFSLRLRLVGLRPNNSS